MELNKKIVKLYWIKAIDKNTKVSVLVGNLPLFLNEILVYDNWKLSKIELIERVKEVVEKEGKKVAVYKELKTPFNNLEELLVSELVEVKVIEENEVFE